MAVGFRKSLFGFNCDDVINYIEKSHKTFSRKESELNNQVEVLSNELDLSKENLENLNREKELIYNKLSAFTEKYEEIERLSENIGKLYLIAQANAQAIIANSESSANLTSCEIEKNLLSLDEAHASLDQLKNNILKTSNEFAVEVDSLINSLIQTKERISANTEANNQCKQQFEEIYNGLTK